jgi:hypothetical protein
MTYLFKLEAFLDALFFSIWVVMALLGVCIVAYRGGQRLTAPRGSAGDQGEGAPRARLPARLLKCAGALVVVYVVAVLVTAHLTHQRLVARFQHAGDGGILGLQTTSDEHELALAADDATKLYEWIRKSRSVKAHHSHPVQEMRLAFITSDEPDEYVYRLGRDSDVEDEFWLVDVSCAGCSDAGRDVKQFRSRELSAYLRSLRGQR